MIRYTSAVITLAVTRDTKVFILKTHVIRVKNYAGGWMDRGFVNCYKLLFLLHAISLKKC